MNRSPPLCRLVSGLLSGLLLASCATQRVHDQGMDAIAAGQYEQGIRLLAQAAHRDPDNTRYNLDWLSERQRVMDVLLSDGDFALAAKRWDEAAAFYARVLKVDPTNHRAQEGLSAVVANRHEATLINEAQILFDQGNLTASAAKLTAVLNEAPKQQDARKLMQQIEDKQASVSFQQPSLNTLYAGPITLEFRDANLKMALEALSRTTGINFIVDHDVPSTAQTTVFVKNSTLEETLDLMLSANQLAKRVVNNKTVFIYPNNPAKQRDNEAEVIRSFYLTNADAKQTMSLIKTFLKTRDIYVDERLNLLVMRDTPEAVQIAEKLIALQDVPDPEVMLDINVLEIDTDIINDLGIQFPDQVNLNALGTGGSATVTLNNIPQLKGHDIQVSGLSANVNLERQLSEGKVLAHPQLRTRNRQKAKIEVGERLPIITTTQNTLTNSTSDSVQYIDVGLTMEVQPDIHSDGDIAVTLSMDVSSLLSQVSGGNGSIAYQIGTRNVNTVLQLHDGETQVLGGLIQKNETRTDDRLPILGDLPLLGRLFSNLDKEKQKTEIVLAITPHIIRNIDRPSRDLMQFWADAASTLSRGGSPEDHSSPYDDMPPAGKHTAPSLRDAAPRAVPISPLVPQPFAPTPVTPPAKLPPSAPPTS